MSPSDFGQLLKPFVFLDLFDNDGIPSKGFGLHPHSGIATLTYVAEGSVRYEDTNGATGVLPASGVEWMQAGGGCGTAAVQATRDGRVAFSFGLAEHRVVDQALLAAQVAPVEGHADEVAGHRLAVAGGANQSRCRAAP